ncbi:MAG: hypothetical protein ISR72_04775 [Methylobacter sp.]|nr:hypothetical protein [Methylobacter sp.]
MGHRKYTPEQIAASRKTWLRGKATESVGITDTKPYFIDSQTGANLNAKHSVRVSRGEYPEPPTLSQSASPIATCSFNYRYHNNGGQGALKYDPVSCSVIHDVEACHTLRQLRGSETVSFTFFPMLLPLCTQFDRKILAVPSIGCPSFLQNTIVVNRLLWAVEARKRPTVLVVHSSEASAYLTMLGDVLERVGVGLVAWCCREPVLGFGVSRLAAQQYASTLGERGDIVLCDVNVVAHEKIASGYDTDNESSFTVKGTCLYTGAGSGSGIPMFKYVDKQGLVPTKAAKGGPTRPIEQVVTVGDEMLYDPCFITSSEDADLTASLLFEESLMRLGRSRLSAKTFKYPRAEIQKLNLGHNTCLSYTRIRDGYLRTLAHEDDVLINYRRRGQVRKMTVGALAKDIASNLKLDPVMIRSLIIEKILLTFKSKYIYTL